MPAAAYYALTLPIMLYSKSHAVLLKFTYYAQYYAHEQELLLYYYASAIHI